jgi:hypothetical protein
VCVHSAEDTAGVLEFVVVLVVLILFSFVFPFLFLFSLYCQPYGLLVSVRDNLDALERVVCAQASNGVHLLVFVLSVCRFSFDGNGLICR